MARHTRKRLAVVAAYLGAILLVPMIAGTINFSNKWFGGEPAQAPTLARALPAPPVPDPNKKTAVVLSSAYGAEITDSLPTFEILARSGQFNVYSVAPERTVLPLVASTMKATSLDFVPHFSFAEYQAQIGAPPDLIAIPYFPFYTPGRDAVVLDWIRAHAGPRTTILAICIGTRVLADTGLLDGRTATANAGDFDALRAEHPATTWVRDVRYVDDGTIVTSTTLAAGIDATLHVVDRFAGRATALDVARQIGYPHTGVLDDPRSEWPDPNSVYAPLPREAFFTGQEQVGVLLYDGVSELGLAGLLDPYTSSISARTFVMAPGREIVRSRNGFLFVPRYDFGSAGRLDRVLAPVGSDPQAKQQVISTWSTSRPSTSVTDLRLPETSGSAYDTTFVDVARTQNTTVALALARTLFYPIEPAQLPGQSWSATGLLVLVGLSLLGAGAVFAARRLNLSRRGRLEPAPQPA
jgi:transcriptional regulator GlxA family with amidase domain